MKLVCLLTLLLVVSITSNVYLMLTSDSVQQLEKRNMGMKIKPFQQKNVMSTSPITTTSETTASLAASTNKTTRITSISSSSQSIPDATLSDEDALAARFFHQMFSNHNIDLDTEQFTIVIMTYKRVKLLQTLIPHYCRTGKYLNKIVIIWNDVDSSIPQDLLEYNCEVSLVYIKPKKNRLTNRFILYPEIETDAIFFIDDDRKLLHEDVVFAFQSWQQFRQKIFGFERRMHTILPDGSYYYGDTGDTLETFGYSLLISANIILHKTYLEMFQIPGFLPTEIKEYIDDHMNCEDIAICIMASAFLERTSYPQTACMSIKARHYPYNLEAQNRGGAHRGLSMRKTHVKGRTDCLNDFRKFYKDQRLPIHYTHARIMHEPEKNYYTDTPPTVGKRKTLQ